MKRETNSNKSFLEIIFMSFFIWHIAYIIIAYAFFLVLDLNKQTALFAERNHAILNFILWMAAFLYINHWDTYFKAVLKFKKAKYRLYTLLGFLFYVIFVMLA